MNQIKPTALGRVARPFAPRKNLQRRAEKGKIRSSLPLYGSGFPHRHLQRAHPHYATGLEEPCMAGGAGESSKGS